MGSGNQVLLNARKNMFTFALPFMSQSHAESMKKIVGAN
jgi:hypothetical protein